MSTTISPETSKRNKFYIPKHRVYELKHYCMQYKSWIKALDDISMLQSCSVVLPAPRRGTKNNSTADIAEIRELMIRNIELVERCAKETDPVIGLYILRAVSEGWGYETLNAREGVPCSSVTYYKLYRKFFWILDKLRN